MFKSLTLRRGAGALVAVFAILLMVAPASAQLDLIKERRGSSGLAVGDPEPNGVPFCVDNRCPGRTCDEVNDRCVGSVALQPAMGDPLDGLSAADLNRFEAGKVAFERTLTPAEGLGPTFNQNSCGSCHTTPLGGSGTITVNRFGFIDCADFGDLSTCTFDPLEDLGGSLQQKETITPGCEEIIPIPETNNVALRVTNSALGFGLVEAIPDADIEINAFNPPSVDVSGKATVAPLLESPGMTAIGRFGWKSQLATVLSFSADAMQQEMGFTNRVLPGETAANGDLALLASCDTVSDPEDIADAGGVEFIDRVTDFQRLLAAPPQTPRSGMTGEAIFNAIGCADCHLSSSFITASTPGLEPALSAKLVKPYSDFLVHDMSFNGDFIAQGDAGITEIRTPLLWGLRVRDPMWHDGRSAAGTFETRITSAINNHNVDGSEGQPSAAAYNALSAEDKAAVIAFLDSLGKREFDHNGDGVVDATDELAFEACFTGPGLFYTPDDACSVSDVDQDGDVDQDDRDLLLVALGVVVDTPPDDEDEDEDNDEDEDENSDDTIFAVGSQAGGGGLVEVFGGGASSAQDSGSTNDAAPPSRDRKVIRRGAVGGRAQGR